MFLVDHLLLKVGIIQLHLMVLLAVAGRRLVECSGRWNDGVSFRGKDRRTKTPIAESHQWYVSMHAGDIQLRVTSLKSNSRIKSLGTRQSDFSVLIDCCHLPKD